MGCTASALQDVDTLPIKAHCRTAFSRCSTTEHVNGQASDYNLSSPTEGSHDVVLCYPLGGTVFGLELQARYEKMDTVSLWTLDHLLSVPGTPVGVTKSMSGGFRNGGITEPALEIKPAPEGEGANTSSNVALCREVRTCRRGVVVLVTAGCTWDDGVLNCLRLAGKFVRPLVMVHCVQSCPLPSLEEWPQDIRPLIAASGPPVKYLAQHSTEALRQVEQRMVEASAGLVATAPNQETQQQQQQRQQGVTQQQQGKQQQLEADTRSQAQGVMQPPTPPLQQQQPAVISSDGGCLDREFWSLRPLRQQQPNLVGNAADAAAATTSRPLSGVSEASPGQPSNSPHANSCADSRPLSLAALQASNSDICRRASQLLGLWTSAGAVQCGGGAARPAGASSDTPVEALLLSAGALDTDMVSTAKDGRVAASMSTPPLPPPSPPLPTKGASERAAPGASMWPHPQEQQPLLKQDSKQQAHLCQRDQAQAAQPGCAEAGGSVRGGGGGGTRCVLRYRDPSWTMPLAFVCAQLEAELGRVSVRVQAAAASAPARQQPSPGTGPSVQLSLPVDSGGLWSHGWRPQIQMQQQDQVQQQQVVASAAVSAAAAALRGSQRSSSGSSGSCIASGGVVARMSETTSHHTSCGVSPGGRRVARVDDELDEYATPPTDDCTTPLLAAASVCSSSSTLSPPAAAAVAASTISLPAPTPASKFELISWPEEDSGQPPGDGAACLVYFMSPGLSAPLVCLAELGAELAAGRRMVLVVDGECCQRLPDYAPVGITPEVWKAMKRLWQQRLLYVSDYHTPFCTLLKQGIAAGVSPP